MTSNKIYERVIMTTTTSRRSHFDIISRWKLTRVTRQVVIITCLCWRSTSVFLQCCGGGGGLVREVIIIIIFAGYLCDGAGGGATRSNVIVCSTCLRE